MDTLIDVSRINTTSPPPPKNWPHLCVSLSLSHHLSVVLSSSPFWLFLSRLLARALCRSRLSPQTQ